MNELLRELVEENGIDRVFQKTISTKDFEISSSEFEGTVVKCNDDSKLRSYFQMICGIFPFVDASRDTHKVGVEFIFEIQEYSGYKKPQQRKGSLKCIITRDGEKIGTKSNFFMF